MPHPPPRPGALPDITITADRIGFTWPRPADSINALAPAATAIDTPPITQPQAQGDVIVLPWPASTTPGMRAERVAATGVVTHDGAAVTPDRRHVLYPDGLPGDGNGPRIRYADVGKGNTLGTLVVEPGAVARLAHPEHADLLIGPGVYVLHQQRAWTPTRTLPTAD